MKTKIERLQIGLLALLRLVAILELCISCFMARVFVGVVSNDA